MHQEEERSRSLRPRHCPISSTIIAMHWWRVVDSQKVDARQWRSVHLMRLQSFVLESRGLSAVTGNPTIAHLP